MAHGPDRVVMARHLAALYGIPQQTLGHPGPPGHGKWRENDRVRDSKGVIWQCTKDGKPGAWAVEG